MTKAEIVETINQELGISKKTVASVVDCVFNEIKEQLLKEEPVKLSGFGNFVVKTRGQRIGRNPKTLEETIIPPRKAVTFKASKSMKDEVNG